MNEASPRVSVILPFFNAEATLSRSLESIAKQEMRDFECIMVDNNSTDGSVTIARSVSRKDSRFRLAREEKQGVMHASNRAFELAGGNYIARMDADDVAYPDRLGLQADFLDRNPDYGAVAGRVRHVGDPESTGGFRRFVDWSNSVLEYRDILLRRFIEAPIVNPTAMWRRETMVRHGAYLHGDFPEDYELWLRWLDRGVKIAKLPQLVLDWHDSRGRLTRTHPLYSDQAFYRVKSAYLARWLEKENPLHPEVWVWGASRISRRRARLLEEEGIRIARYIDTKKSRQLDRKLVYYKELPPAGEAFILTYIRQRDSRDRIRDFLEESGYREGINYLLVS